jgi:hypothetical protein
LISTPIFANGSAGAEYVASNGEWLNVPDAVLFSNSGSNNQAILLSLQNPLYNEDDKVRISVPFPSLIHLKCHWASLSICVAWSRHMQALTGSWQYRCIAGPARR